MAQVATMNRSDSLADIVDRVLDKGLVINADISISIVGTELLNIKIRAALASFETAAKYGMEFPSGTNLNMPAWKKAMEEKESCPKCGKRHLTQSLMETGCPWCGWAGAGIKNMTEAVR
ncbi:MAG: gas vesicle protein [Deltaproteobacteria bacterium]|nr:gas vesicle protein [Deltaproteobacteria bacterium]